MQDPLKYFRVEAREIIGQLQTALLELERGEAQVAVVSKLLRLSHTLKGAARVVKQLEIATISHQLEDVLVPLRDSTESVAPDVIEKLLGLADQIAVRVASLDPLPSSPSPAAQPVAEPTTVGTQRLKLASAPSAEEPLRVSAAPLEHVESLMDGVSELGFQLGSLRQSTPVLTECRNLAEQLAERLDPRRSMDWGLHGAVGAQALASQLETRLGKLERETARHIERATRELGQVRDRVDQLRLVAASTMFGSLERATRDSAVSLGKLAQFEGSGGEIRLDADVLAAVQRALVQGVRNAVAHGIEPSDERKARGKPPSGRVRLQVHRRGAQICFVCQDDGRGVSLPDVRKEAERLGRAAAGSQSPSASELLALLLRGGISTSKVISEVAGRGVGLDLIREALASVGGSVAIDTTAGAGTSLELTVPASLSALEALLVEADGEVSALPLKSVMQAMRVASRDFNRTAETTSLLFEGRVVPFFPLGWLLRARHKDERERSFWTVIILRGNEGLLALGVDRLLGADSIVARGLPDTVDVDSTVVGVTLDSDGNPRPLLDPDGLLAAAAHTPLRTAHTVSRKRHVLVVDDSLTTRMLEQSILESAGYDVDTATSAEQGLELAEAGDYDLFLVDVEMPGMDGFSFVERVRQSPKLSKTPAVLVTSRASPEDLARGRAAGASDHIAKGEFDQVDFLDRIGRLMR